jgi:hypothetical protein
MGGVAYKTGIFRMTSSTIREKGGIVINFAGQVVGPVTAKVDLGLPAGQKIGVTVTASETLATIAGDTDSRATFRPYLAGTYAGQVAGEYVIVQANTKIAGVASTLLKNSAGDWKRNSINTKKPYGRARKVTAINYITGALTSSAKTYYWHALSAAAKHPETVVTTQQDHAAIPNITRAIPGEFTISQTGATPTSKDYDAKTD